MILDAKFTESNHELPCDASVAVFVLPIANEYTLGGVMPAPQTNVMSQPVGVDSGGRLWTEPSKVNPMPKTEDMTKAVGMDETGCLWTTPSEGGGGGGGGEPYVLPIATETTLGGVKPAPRTDVMSQPVGVDDKGHLWTYPCEVNPMPIQDGMTQVVGKDEYGGLWTYPSADKDEIVAAVIEALPIYNGEVESV